jgi:alpha-ribazole phosphatase
MRHTRPVLSSDYCYGSLDIDVASSFESDARAALRQLTDVTRIVSSPLIRARRLAEWIAERRGMPVSFDPRITEMDFASWEGRRWSDIPRSEIDVWAADFMDGRPHGGESVRMLRARCVAALEEYSALAGDTLVVCHSGVVRAVCANGGNASDFATSIGFGETLHWPGSGKGSSS